MNDAERLSVLQSVSLFSEVSEGELAHLSSLSTDVVLVAGEILYRQDAPAEYVFLLASGEVELITVQGRSNLVIARRSRHEVFGESAVFDGVGNYLLTALAASDVAAIKIPAGAFRLFVERHASVAHRLLRLMAVVIRRSTESRR